MNQYNIKTEKWFIIEERLEENSALPNPDLFKSEVQSILKAKTKIGGIKDVENF